MMPGYSPYLLSELKPIISRDSLKFVTFACNKKKNSKGRKIMNIKWPPTSCLHRMFMGSEKKSGATSTH